MKRLLFILASALLALFFTTTAQAATTFDPAAAPTGTHVQTGTPSCGVHDGVVTCSPYELAGVGNTDARATLTASYSATVRCRNHGGQIVDVKSQVTGATATTGSLRAKNGRLSVPSLSSSPVPTAADFEKTATCPNGNWTKETLTSTIALTGYTYTLQFQGFAGNYITITG